MTLYAILLISLTVFLANIPLIFTKMLSKIFPKIFYKINNLSYLNYILWGLWFAAYFIMIYILNYIETQQAGRAHEQTWEFHAITFLVYLIFAYPSLMQLLFRKLKNT